MRNQHQKQFLKRLLASRGIVVFEILVIVFLLVGITKEVVRRVALKQEISALEKQITELEAQNRSLGEYVASINTESFREREARKRLNLQKPGETLLILPETEDLANPSPGLSSAETTEPGMSNPTRWWRYFFSSTSN
ncbi:septum formation initiator family protein [Candidatus Parcubacteria bacterium]|jgi:cell division protein FtsB|nr:MAG: septum formation initiator family protein [Candidatus Parcubacteria bacterium]